MRRMVERSHAETELAALGEELRREREMRGISLREISDATKVSTRYLEGLEAGDAKALPAPVFVRGFVREFARYLGLDAEEMVDRYLRSVSELEREREAQIREANPQLREYDPTRDEGKVRAILTTLFIILLLAAIAAAVWFFRDSLSALKRFLPGQQTEAEMSQSEPPAAASVDTPAPATSAAEIGEQAPAVEPLTMTIEFREPTWIHLLVDGETALHETVNTGTVREFRADEQIEIRTLGNAGGVHVTLDDREIGALGASRQVIKGRVFENPRAVPSPE